MPTPQEILELLSPAALTPVEADGADRAAWLVRVPGGLRQGRGAWGGVGVAIAGRAAQAAVADPERRLRSLSAQLVAPLPAGEVRATADVVRHGGAVSTVAVRIGDPAGSETYLSAVVVLGVARPKDAMVGLPPDAMAPPAALRDGFADVPPIGPGMPMAPEFLAALEIRPLAGLPYSGVAPPEATTIGWVRLVDAPAAAVDEVVLTALADAWWVAVMPLLDAPRPVATLSFAVEVAIDASTLPQQPDGTLTPLLHRGRLRAANEGYTVESRELWTADGRLATWNSQTVAVIR